MKHYEDFIKPNKRKWFDIQETFQFFWWAFLKKKKKKQLKDKFENCAKSINITETKSRHVSHIPITVNIIMLC